MLLPQLPLFDIDDDDAPSDGWSKWGLGIAIPSLLGLHGVSCIITRQATLSGRVPFKETLFGQDAVIHGILLVATALLMHAGYFMPNSKRASEFAGLVKVVALAVGIVAGGFLFVRRTLPM